mmetsp:Transcript_4130/g.8950  ORF Transcript_4130/g.8950 Transcript_4130/m.8950 type:complete len:86 (+) Transcript_4130:1387-1644(+)
MADGSLLVGRRMEDGGQEQGVPLVTVGRPLSDTWADRPNVMLLTCAWAANCLLMHVQHAPTYAPHGTCTCCMYMYTLHISIHQSS